MLITKMGRPFIQRVVGCRPKALSFRPAGLHGRAPRLAMLALDEFEALRLVDGEGLDQRQAALRMRVSRATVGRILGHARRKIARALLEGAAIAIQPGHAPVRFEKPSRFRAKPHLQTRKGGGHVQTG